MTPEGRARLARRVKEAALREGAQLAGIAPPDPPVETEYLKAWVAEGKQGSMGYLARAPEARADVRNWYPEAKSVLVCAFSYAGPDEEPGAAEPSPRGRVARYAVLPDYHQVLKARMRSVLDAVRAVEPSAEGRVFVDTSPVLEKGLARRAGLGWMGKNTLLIHPRLGSYSFLAGLALNLDLPSDEPVTDHCGTCRRCLDACPTGAFDGPYRLDASRCIAYLTIEHKGPVPEGLREGLGDWVFGCDVCQEVCPWNRFAVRPALPEFQAPSWPLSGPLRDCLKVGPEEFGELKKTPIERARWRGWIRNALNAAGNSGDPSMAAEVEPWTRHPDPVLSDAARGALARLKGPAERPA